MSESERKDVMPPCPSCGTTLTTDHVARGHRAFVGDVITAYLSCPSCSWAGASSIVRTR